MTLFNFAYNNITRDFKIYLYHFVSSVFSVLIFFLFSTLAMHPALEIVDSKSTIGIIIFMANIISIIFSSVLILYSVGNFLKNRSRQFAILNIIGASKGQFNKLIFLENIIISSFALLVGIITGLVFSKFFLMIAQGMIGGLNLYFYFPFKALTMTLLLMGGLFFIIALLAPVILRKERVIDLLKKEEVAEKNHFLLSLIALIIILPPTVYFHIKEEFFIFVYVLEILAFISVSYFLFNLIFNIYYFAMKKSGNIYKKNNLIKLSNFKYNINTNIKTMSAATILFCITLTAFVYIVGSPQNTVEDTEKIMPYAYMYANWENKEKGEQKASIIEDRLSDVEGIKNLTISFGKIKNEKRTVRHVILSDTMYNSIADLLNRDEVELADDEYFLVGVDGKNEPTLSDTVREKIVEHGIREEYGSEKRIIAVSCYFTSVTVVSQSKYNEILKELVEDRIYVFIKKDPTKDEVKLEDLEADIDFETGKETLMSYYYYYNSENLTRKLVSYVGSILCISFLIGIASIIYSRLYSSLKEECKKYNILIKLGLSRDNLKDILSSTLRWVFVLPFITSMVISWIFIVMINRVTLASYTSLAGVCSIIYLIVEFTLYIIIKSKYQKMIFDNI